MDSRFNKLYILKIEEGEIDRLRHVCEDFRISRTMGHLKMPPASIEYGELTKMDSFIYLTEWLNEDLTLIQLMSLKNF